jgi:hypothetical protein
VRAAALAVAGLLLSAHVGAAQPAATEDQAPATQDKAAKDQPAKDQPASEKPTPAKDQSPAAEEQPAPTKEVPPPAKEQPPAAKEPPPPAKGQPAPPKIAPIATTDAIGILGKRVHGPAGEDMGLVADVVVDDTGTPRAAIIDFGGFLGVGSRKIAIDWHLLQFSPANTASPITLALGRKDIQAAPEYKPAAPAPVVVDAPPPAPPQPVPAQPAPSVPASSAPASPPPASPPPPAAPEK